MGFKLGMIVGSGVGYVLGTRAGRERYDQIRQQYQKMKGSEPAQKLSGEAQRIADQASRTVGQKANEGADKITEATQDKVGGQSATGTGYSR